MREGWGGATPWNDLGRQDYVDPGNVEMDTKLDNEERVTHVGFSLDCRVALVGIISNNQLALTSFPQASQPLWG
jgi:hypothetical protein